MNFVREAKILNIYSKGGIYGIENNHSLMLIFETFQF